MDKQTEATKELTNKMLKISEKNENLMEWQLKTQISNNITCRDEDVGCKFDHLFVYRYWYDHSSQNLILRPHKEVC